MAFFHVVLMRYNDETTEGQIAESVDEGLAFGALEGVEVVAVGEVAETVKMGGGSDHAFTHALVVRIADDAALARYREDPRHAVHAETMIPRIAELAIIDIPTLDP